jgi:hypothetical protein
MLDAEYGVTLPDSRRVTSDLGQHGIPKHPERFVRKIPSPPALPAVAWINQPEEAANSLNQ